MPDSVSKPNESIEDTTARVSNDVFCHIWEQTEKEHDMTFQEYLDKYDVPRTS